MEVDGDGKGGGRTQWWEGSFLSSPAPVQTTSLALLGCCAGTQDLVVCPCGKDLAFPSPVGYSLLWSLPS